MSNTVQWAETHGKQVRAMKLIRMKQNETSVKRTVN